MTDDRIVEVYRAKSGLQAHLFVRALEKAGIHARLDGNVQASWTTGPAGWSEGDPRILVFERDAAAAREVLLALEEKERGN